MPRPHIAARTVSTVSARVAGMEDRPAHARCGTRHPRTAAGGQAYACAANVARCGHGSSRSGYTGAAMMGNEGAIMNWQDEVNPEGLR